MKEFGIDISHWQGDFDFKKAIQEGVKFVIIKGGGGDSGLYTDSKFLRNYNEAKKYNLPVGVYWFSKALSIEDAKIEATYFINNILKNKQFELPIYMDVEHEAQLKLGKRLLTDIVKTFCSCLEDNNYFAGIYSSLSYFNTYLIDSELTKYTHWVASWTTKCTYKETECFGLWQFGGETNLIRSNKVAGTICDQNYLLIDYPSKIKNSNLNGFKKGNDNMKFKDIEKHIAEEAIIDLYNMGIIKGTSDDTYEPNEPLTRGDVALLLRRTIKYLTGK